MNKEQIQELINNVRKTYPQKLAEDLVNVQPFNEKIDWDALAAHPLWISYCERHIRRHPNREDSTK